MEQCEHPIIFHYGDGTSQCNDCGMKFVKLHNGERIDIESLINYFEATQEVK